MVTTNQKPTTDTQKWRGKEHKHTSKKIIKPQRKKKKLKEEEKNRKDLRKQPENK